MADVSPRPRDNQWARLHDLADKRVLLYSGTLGMKHDPGLLLHLARALEDLSDVRVVVVSEGLGAEWLRENGEAARNLVIMPFQDVSDLANMVATADIAVAILEPEAGTFSVPSKILTYMAGGRPIVAALPAANLATRLIVRASAGRVVAPGDRGGLANAARELLANGDERHRLGVAGRAYALSHFAIEPIADQFESVFDAAVGESSRPGVHRPGAARPTVAPNGP
jgi:glycosyltransferase involved in cell wall biosynthesis